jgi:hypothetical protein
LENKAPSKYKVVRVSPSLSSSYSGCFDTQINLSHWPPTFFFPPKSAHNKKRISFKTTTDTFKENTVPFFLVCFS